MYLLFTARCVRCGNRFKAEAEERTKPTAPADYAYTCPRCHTPGTVSAGDGIPSGTSTGWAVLAAATEPAR
jgi:hypothetical protein